MRLHEYRYGYGARDFLARLILAALAETPPDEFADQEIDALEAELVDVDTDVQEPSRRKEEER